MVASKAIKFTPHFAHTGQMSQTMKENAHNQHGGQIPIIHWDMKAGSWVHHTICAGMSNPSTS